MRWLNSLRNYLRIKGRQKSVSTSEGYELGPRDLVSRFIYSSKTLIKSQGRVRPSAFSPEPHPKLSVLHSSGLEDHEVWKCGQRTLGTKRGRDKIYGRADITVGKLIAQELKAIRDDDPFERHTSVVGWPQSDDADRRKADIKAICLELSQDADTKVFILDQPLQNFQ